MNKRKMAWLSLLAPIGIIALIVGNLIYPHTLINLPSYVLIFIGTYSFGKLIQNEK
jgi:hypothetical protein